jgi:hypothetical protein
MHAAVTNANPNPYIKPNPYINSELLALSRIFESSLDPSCFGSVESDYGSTEVLGSGSGSSSSISIGNEECCTQIHKNPKGMLIEKLKDSDSNDIISPSDLEQQPVNPCRLGLGLGSI